MLQVASLHQRLSVKANVFVYGIRSKNTNPPSPMKRKKNKEKKVKNISRFYFHIRGQATGHPKQPRQQ